MSLHTAQHLLSSVIDTTLKALTFTGSLTPWPSPAYIDLPRPLTAAEISRVQDRVNHHVLEGRRVHVEVDKLRAGQAGIDPGEPPALSSRELGRGLPADYSGGVHRMMIIEGIDRTPCCGTHLPTLSTLQLFLFPTPTSTSSTSFRHFFLVGPRLLNHLASVQALLARRRAFFPAVPRTPQSALPSSSMRANDGTRERRVEDLERELAGSLAVGSRKKWLNCALLVWRANGLGASAEQTINNRTCDLTSSHPRFCSTCSGTSRLNFHALTRVFAFFSNAFVYDRGHVLRVRGESRKGTW